MKFIIFTLSAYLVDETYLLAAEAGMPQLDPKYWFSQGFWLIITFVTLYILIAQLFIPKIKNNIDDRERKIKDDLEKAKSYKENSEIKNKEYEQVIEKSKKEISKMIYDTRKKLEKDIQNKKQIIEKQINDEIKKTENEIKILKQNSLSSIEKISEELTSKIAHEITGEQLNQSSIKAIVSEVTKKNFNKIIS